MKKPNLMKKNSQNQRNEHARKSWKVLHEQFYRLTLTRLFKLLNLLRLLELQLQTMGESTFLFRRQTKFLKLWLTQLQPMISRLLQANQ